MSNQTSGQYPGILIVDDEEPMRSLFSELLRDKPYIVRTAADTSDARRILGYENMDVIICDENMPGEGGVSLLTELKETHPALQRILTTGSLSEDLMMRGINEANLLRYIPKPVSPQVLYEAIADALQIAQQEKELEEAAHTDVHYVEHKRAVILHLTFTVLIAVFAIAITAIVLFVLIYLMKCLLGIDLLPNHHLGDFL